MSAARQRAARLEAELFRRAADRPDAELDPDEVAERLRKAGADERLVAAATGSSEEPSNWLREAIDSQDRQRAERNRLLAPRLFGHEPEPEPSTKPKGEADGGKGQGPAIELTSYPDHTGFHEVIDLNELHPRKETGTNDN
jgi:hypothetical protein